MAHSLGSARPVLRRAPPCSPRWRSCRRWGRWPRPSPAPGRSSRAAEHELERLEDRIVDQKAVLGRLSRRSPSPTGAGRSRTPGTNRSPRSSRTHRRQLRDAQEEYQALQGTLEERAREAYIVGPGSELEFLLGASTTADLSARMEYVNALNEEDADLATEVQNLRNMLAMEKADQEALQAKRERALEDVETQLAVLDGSSTSSRRSSRT